MIKQREIHTQCTTVCMYVLLYACVYTGNSHVLSALLLQYGCVIRYCCYCMLSNIIMFVIIQYTTKARYK